MEVERTRVSERLFRHFQDLLKHTAQHTHTFPILEGRTQIYSDYCDDVCINNMN